MGQAEPRPVSSTWALGKHSEDLFEDGGRMVMHSAPTDMGLGAAHPWEPTFLFSLKELVNGIDKSNWGGFVSLKLSKKCSLVQQHSLDWGCAGQLAELSKSVGKTRNNSQTTLSRSLPEHSFLSSRCLMFEQAVIRQRVTAAGAWNVTRAGRVVNNKQEWLLLLLVTAICIAWLQAGNISQMANCKFLYLRANKPGCSSRMLSAEITSWWGSGEPEPAALRWSHGQRSWVLLVCAGRWLPGWGGTWQPPCPCCLPRRGCGNARGAGTSVCLAYPGECWKVN